MQLTSPFWWISVGLIPLQNWVCSWSEWSLIQPPIKTQQEQILHNSLALALCNTAEIKQKPARWYNSIICILTFYRLCVTVHITNILVFTIGLFVSRFYGGNVLLWAGNEAHPISGRLHFHTMFGREQRHEDGREWPVLTSPLSSLLPGVCLWGMSSPQDSAPFIQRPLVSPVSSLSGWL